MAETLVGNEAKSRHSKVACKLLVDASACKWSSDGGVHSPRAPSICNTLSRNTPQRKSASTLQYLVEMMRR